jgi:putative flavoprotein involved in K+ transport
MKTHEEETPSGGAAARFIEPGEAFRRLGGLEASERPERLDVLVIGGGQAGLSVGYHLRRRGLRFVILDASARIGDAWRNRWDSLRLFSPAKLDGLDGMRFPAPPNSFPTKDQMADYLEAYAARFELPVRTGARVERLFRRESPAGHAGTFVARLADGGELEAEQVVVAMGNYQQRRLPGFASALRPDIVQVHASDYRSPKQLRPGGVLLVGAGNSGAEIGLELMKAGHETWIAGRGTGEVPFANDGLAARLLLTRLVMRGVFHRLLTVRTPMGRKLRPKVMTQGTPLIRIKRKHLLAAGAHRVGRVVGTRDGMPLLDDGQTLDVANVVWSTGYHGAFSWIDLPVVAADGEPIHDAGVSTDVPGLYFVGLHFLYSMSSAMIHGVGRDARRIVEAVRSRTRAARH